MTLAVNLTEAASLSYAQSAIFWTANTLDTQLAAFVAAASPIFDDNVPKDRTVGNWLVLLKALTSQMSSGVVAQADFDLCATYLFRMCYQGATMAAQGQITNAQRDALLAAWNAHIGT